MIHISNPYKWLFPVLGLAMLLIYIDWASGIRAILIGGMGASIADGINARFIKPNTDRIRPGKQYAEIRSLGSMNQGRKSFPSNHASNTMSFTLGIGLIFPWSFYILVPLSILVGYSRIYCGAHYPLDVLFGWVHGMFWVSIIFELSRILF
ncbi:MAG: phosphatase PAP2 family protein [Candidatus Marinimicrobia bacterium]|nr:phosphatase PAP2 family protein [Candidatus Neomarinimicrobiota bacterium]